MTPDGGADTENVTEIDTEESSSSSLTESDSDEWLDKGCAPEQYLPARKDRSYIEEVVIGREQKAMIQAQIKHKKV